MTKLAIKGHTTRGKEVIEILEMLGGEDKYQVAANRETYVYFVNEYKNIDLLETQLNQIHPEQFIVFTLEEFLEKFPYKVGDKVHIPEYESEVRICKMLWHGFGDIEYLVYRNDEGEWYTADELKEYNADFLTDKKYCETSNNITLNNPDKEGEKKSLLVSLIEHFRTTPKDELEREWNEHNELDEIGPTVEEYIAFVESIKKQPDYKKQQHYPKTYEECCKILMSKPDFQDYSLVLTKLSTNKNEENSISPEPPHITLINNFYKLLICRDAYWKIAGEEMGLGKPWEPDWKKADEKKYCIVNTEGSITKWIQKTTNKILAFPTEEMRDAFYENFKYLIEECKELL